MLEIDILRNSSQKLGVLRGVFYGFGCPKRHPEAMLAKIMAVFFGSPVFLYICYMVKTQSHAHSLTEREMIKFVIGLRVNKG